ncbi:hypothetical protein [Mycobacterium sp.]|uniref:hypothetical protein n=1 Tax=Mycobacterium sp. TaxID=1785 RepID=UPI002BF9BC75|nr:hypothetical protein [Mycobacterium sp.]HTQ20706.1 hypothetical protein [Mycobacterium sp.]
MLADGEGVLATGCEVAHPANATALNANHAKCFRVMPRDSAVGYTAQAGWPGRA